MRKPTYHIIYTEANGQHAIMYLGPTAKHNLAGATRVLRVMQKNLPASYPVIRVV